MHDFAAISEDQFHRMSRASKWEWVKALGEFRFSLRTNEYEVHIYQLQSFQVEVWVESSTRKLDRIKRFAK